MKRLLFTCLVFVLSSISVSAQEVQEGVNFVRLSAPQPTQTENKIEVLELFWYHCPHCYRLEPYLKRWLKNKPDNVAYVRMPAILNDHWRNDAHAFYTMQALGLMETLHDAYFSVLHEERKRIVTAEHFSDWAAEHGADPQKVLETFNSMGVVSRVNKAILMTRNYQADGVPTIIVGGTYRTSVSMAGGPNELIDIINHLAAKVQEER